MAGKKPPISSSIRVKPLDIAVIALGAALTVAVGVSAYMGSRSAPSVIIRGPEATWVFPINAEETITVAGAIGETIVCIHDGHAEIISSPCGGQTCVAAGAMHKNGQWTACLPNKVFVLIEGLEGKDGVDAASW